MGLLMEFYAGNGQEIGAAFTEGDFDRLSALPLAQADFSLHLSPTDLDILSETAFEMMGRTPIGLLDSLKASVGGNDEENGADVVSESWVAGFAAFPDERVHELALRWMTAVAEDHGEPGIGVTPDSLQAIRELINVCRLAEREKVDVVHTWAL